MAVSTGPDLQHRHRSLLRRDGAGPVRRGHGSRVRRAVARRQPRALSPHANRRTKEQEFMPTIEADGASLYYSLEGPADAPVVMFSNSLAATTQMWDDQAELLRDEYRVLRYDNRGHGGSAPEIGRASCRERGWQYV